MLRRVFALLLLLGTVTPGSASAQAVAVPAGLPSHFGFGLAAGHGDTWMPESGIPWTYRFQYLAGGVNTGQGWETWGPNGIFPLNYANESAQRGYIPMFPYYELFQSNGSCNDCPENQKNISNLNNPSTMNAYFNNFALLMKRLGTGNHDGIQGFGKVALVNIEPDFTGGYAVQAVNSDRCFGACTGRGNDPSLLRASVWSSGSPEAAGHPDTYAGFTQALAAIRDRYAPNVLLGYDVSPWGAGVDVGMDTRSNIDAVGLGRQVGTFLSQVGVHEVLFNNPLDRDAGQYKALFGQNRWWDRHNVSFPNFHRWEQFLNGAITADGSKPMLLWQVPAGNQVYRSVNNTDGHFQDNRAEYIFGHVPELIQTGVVGAMFSPGNAGGTVWGDGQRDGITNPPPICTTDGTSSGQICNDQVSSVPDDDGGFLRLSAHAYYQNPIQLQGVTLPTPATPVSMSTPAAALEVQLRASGVEPNVASPGQEVAVWQELIATSDANLLVDFELYDAQGQKVWQTWHDGQPLSGGAATTQTAQFTIDNLPPGDYVCKIGVFSAGWGTLYAWNDEAASLRVEP
jgi:hypothetical protein